MKFSLKSLLTIAAAASTLILAGCGEKAVDNNKVKIGVMAGLKHKLRKWQPKWLKKIQSGCRTGDFYRLRNTKRGIG